MDEGSFLLQGWEEAEGFMGPSWLASPVRSCPWTAQLFVGRGGAGSGEGLLRAACLYGGMSGMFGIWVFTSQGAHGSLVLKSVSFIQGGGPCGPSRGWIWRPWSCYSRSALGQLDATKHPHLLPLAQVFFYARVGPWVLEAGTPQAALLLSPCFTWEGSREAGIY